MLRKNDRDVLAGLGARIRDISSDPVNQERKILWKKLNDLRPVRPLVFIFEIPWHEMEYGNELTPFCADPFLQQIETGMRRTIYRWEHMQGDMVVEGYVSSPLAIGNTGTGIEEDTDVSVTDKDSDIFSRHFKIQIKTEDDLQKIKNPVITHDEEESERRFQLLSEIFDGIIPVRKVGIKGTSIAPWDQLVRLTGINEILTDMLARPGYVHKLIARMTEAHIAALAQYYELNLLNLNNDDCFLGGGLQYTDELPKPGFNPVRVRPADMWGRAMSQIFAAVSPAMHEEFALEYELQYLGRFGLAYYGCCEPLHKKIDILRKIPNLRKISMSPWVDAREGAAAIGKDYVYSFKANPAFLGWKAWNPESVRNELKKNLDITRDCITEVILKDISTVNYQPQRLWEWVDIAMEIAGNT